MKKIVLLTAALVASASLSYAGIANTKHDLSTTTSQTYNKSATTTQICIFCHTPHNATVNVPLWNRTNPAATGWQMYNSPTLSATASAKLATGTFDSDSISLFCLSCHDGTTALGAFQNRAGLAADALPAIVGTGNLGAGTKAMANDHPIGFDYDQAATEDTAANLHNKTNANSALGGNAFFGGAGNQLECASCHKVHDNTNAPFLRITNVGSALCLACHNK